MLGDVDFDELMRALDVVLRRNGTHAAAFPLEFIPNVVPGSRAGHPKTIVMLTPTHRRAPADRKALRDQAMIFLGVPARSPGPNTASPATGDSFPPVRRDVHGTSPHDVREAAGAAVRYPRRRVWLVNTGGPAARTRREAESIAHTRAIVNAAIKGRIAPESDLGHFSACNFPAPFQRPRQSARSAGSLGRPAAYDARRRTGDPFSEDFKRFEAHASEAVKAIAVKPPDFADLAGYDHVNCRVASLGAVKSYYDALMPELGLPRKRYSYVDEAGDWHEASAEHTYNAIEFYEDAQPDRAPCFVGFIERSDHVAGLTRIAFRVNPGRMMELEPFLQRIGARNVERSASSRLIQPFSSRIRPARNWSWSHGRRASSSWPAEGALGRFLMLRSGAGAGRARYHKAMKIAMTAALLAAFCLPIWVRRRPTRNSRRVEKGGARQLRRACIQALDETPFFHRAIVAAAAASPKRARTVCPAARPAARAIRKEPTRSAIRSTRFSARSSRPNCRPTCKPNEPPGRLTTSKCSSNSCRRVNRPPDSQPASFARRPKPELRRLEKSGAVSRVPDGEPCHTIDAEVGMGTWHVGR